MLKNSMEISVLDTRYKRQKPLKPAIKYFKSDGNWLRYAVSGKPEGQLLLFIHGAPGSWDNFRYYLKDPVLAKTARMVSVDRPGYGKSMPGQMITSLQRQAELISPLLAQDSSGKGAIVVGHSYGGPVAAAIAMFYPEKVAGLVMLAPALDPDNEKLFWFNKPVANSFVNNLLPDMLRVANNEKMTHAAELRKLLPHWGKLQMPVTMLHGEQDRIVPVANIDFARKMITAAPLRLHQLKGANHLIPWNRAGLVRKTLLQHLEGQVPR